MRRHAVAGSAASVARTPIVVLNAVFFSSRAFAAATCSADGALSPKNSAPSVPAPPRQPGLRVEHRADGVHNDQRRNRRARRRTLLEHDAGGADAALEGARARPGPGADASAEKLPAAGAGGRAVTEIGVGAHGGVADGQVVDDGAGDYRHDRPGLRRAGFAQVDALAVFLEPAHHAVGGGEAVGTAAREQDGVHPLHRVRRVQQVGLAGARTTAADVDRRHRTAGSQHHRASGGHARAHRGVGVEFVVVTDAQADDVGERVVATAPHGASACSSESCIQVNQW